MEARDKERKTMQAIASVGDLDSKQREFLLRQGQDPKDEGEMDSLAKRFNQAFSADVTWRTVRRLVTNLQRKQRRRNGGRNDAVSLPDPPCIKVAPGSV